MVFHNAMYFEFFIDSFFDIRKVLTGNVNESIYVGRIKKVHAPEDSV